MEEVQIGDIINLPFKVVKLTELDSRAILVWSGNDKVRVSVDLDYLISLKVKQ